MNRLLLLGLALVLASCGDDSFTAKENLCLDSVEAAHYIASMSSDSNDVVRVTNSVIAEKKYPALGDKVVASIGGVVALSLGHETPTQIGDKILRSCEQQSGTTSQ